MVTGMRRHRNHQYEMEIGLAVSRRESIGETGAARNENLQCATIHSTYSGKVPVWAKILRASQVGLVAADEIQVLMTDTEAELYSGIVSEFDAKRWIYFAHFYDTKKVFYNILYTVGYLFSNLSNCERWRCRVRGALW